MPLSKQASVPYCTVKGFRKCLDLLRGVPTDEPIGRQSLIDRGFWPHAVYPVLGALRFLGLIDDDGRATPSLKPFLDDDIEGRREAVEQAYSGVLAHVSFPVEDREEVDRVFVERLGCAPGVAAFCSTFFLWLAAEAGLPVAVLGPRRRGRPPAHLAQLSAAARACIIERGRELGLSVDIDDLFARERRTGMDAPADHPRPAARSEDAG